VAALSVLALPNTAMASVKVTAGTLAVSGTAQVAGALARTHHVAVHALVLSADVRYGAGDQTLTAVFAKKPKGSFQAWVSLRDDQATGKFQLLACSTASPSQRSCWPAGSVRVAAPVVAPVATPVLSGTSADLQVHWLGGSTSLTAPDGTTYTLNVPRNGVLSYEDLTMTLVSALSPASAAGTLRDGVMVSPVGAAPVGATLTITPSKKIPASARLVAFGGVDPSGGVFQLPMPLLKTVTIRLSALGGYGIVTGSVLRSRPANAACEASTLRARGSRPLTSCLSFAERFQQMSKAVEKELGAARQSTLLGQEPPPSFDGLLSNVLEVASLTVEREMSQIEQSPPTDEGLAALQVMMPYELGIQRQAELLGVPVPSSFGDVANGLIDYANRLLRQKCSSPGASSIDLMVWSRRSLDIARSLYRWGRESEINGALAVGEQCFKRVRLYVDVTADATGGDADARATVSATAKQTLVTGSDPNAVFPNLLWGPRNALSYKSSTASLGPVLSLLPGESVQVTQNAGTIQLGGVGFSADYHIRCDMNRQFQVDKKVTIFFLTDGVWADTQTQVFSGTFSATRTAGMIAGAWGMKYPQGTGQWLKVTLDPYNSVDTQTVSGNGTINDGFNTPWALNLSFTLSDPGGGPAS
jgi:hypothetical protein